MSRQHENETAHFEFPRLAAAEFVCGHPGRLRVVCADLPTKMEIFAMSTDREPTPAERAGMEWWNNATEAERRHWMQMAGNTGVAADAYRAWRLDQERRHQEQMR